MSDSASRKEFQELLKEYNAVKSGQEPVAATLKLRGLDKEQKKIYIEAHGGAVENSEKVPQTVTTVEKPVLSGGKSIIGTNSVRNSFLPNTEIKSVFELKQPEGQETAAELEVEPTTTGKISQIVGEKIERVYSITGIEEHRSEVLKSLSKKLGIADLSLNVEKASKNIELKNGKIAEQDEMEL